MKTEDLTKDFRVLTNNSVKNDLLHLVTHVAANDITSLFL